MMIYTDWMYWAIAAAAVACTYGVVRADFRRRGLLLRPLLMTLVLDAALIGSGELLSDWLHISAFFLGVVLAGVLMALACRQSVLVLLDVAAAAFALLASITYLVILLAEPRFFTVSRGIGAVVSFIAVYWLWQEGRRSVQWQRPRGIVFGEFLVLGGGAALLEVLLGRGPRSVTAEAAALISIASGAILLTIIVPRFLRTREEHRIIADVTATGESLQPEYTPATPECPHPELWKMYDSMSAEVEVLDFLRQLVITLKPNLVVETGTFMGVSTLAIAEGLKQNGFGRVITVEFDPKVFAKAKERIDASGLGPWIDARNQSSLDLQVEGTIDLLFSDSDIHVREREVRHYLTQISPTGLILIHDASSLQKVVREAALRLEAEGLISVVLVPTPRGLVVAQKRSGRK
ncbi:MAG TPA: CmcI family methyltransferase [Terriglobales bacterium]|nr:CmcI family methyltransferase [Terriglobales bacterium]